MQHPGGQHPMCLAPAAGDHWGRARGRGWMSPGARSPEEEWYPARFGGKRGFSNVSPPLRGWI